MLEHAEWLNAGTSGGVTRLGSDSTLGIYVILILSFPTESYVACL